MGILGRDPPTERQNAPLAADAVEINQLRLDTQPLLPLARDDLAATPPRSEIVPVLLEDLGARLVRIRLRPTCEDKCERRVWRGHDAALVAGELVVVRRGSGEEGGGECGGAGLGGGDGAAGADGEVGEEVVAEPEAEAAYC